MKIQKLEAAHRYHLRCLLRIHWPQKISNVALYKDANSSPIRKEMVIVRWKYLYKTLHMHPSNAAYSTMWQYYANETEAPKHKGVPITLPLILHKNLQLIGKSLRICQDFGNIEDVAKYNK